MESADRILGFGDIVGLMQDFEKVVDEKQAEEDAEKILSGQFNMTDFLEQIRTIKKMGSLKDVMAKMPGLGDMMPEGADLDDRELVKVEAMISSMTKGERADPSIINESRARRIAKGSGRGLEEVHGLIQRFDGMRKMMSQIGSNPGLLGRIPGMKQLGQLKALKGMGMGDLMGEMAGMGGGMPGVSKRQLIKQAKQYRRAGQPMPPELQEALRAAGVGSGSRPAGPKVTADDLAKKKDRRRREKQARASRKKSRKRK